MFVKNDSSICIYCQESRYLNEFHKEHVIPECFGKFTPKNLILYKDVYAKCNRYLGRKIETFLCRDTIEGIVREKIGIMSKESRIEYRRVKWRIPNGLKKGVILSLESDRIGKAIINVVTQVGLFNSDKGRYDFFEPKDVPNKTELLESGYDISGKMINIISDSVEEREKAVEILREKDIDFHIKANKSLYESIETISGQIKVKMFGELDPIVQRGFCKIAFNYMAFIAAKEFCLNDDFHPVREFILCGKGNGRDFLRVEKSGRGEPEKPGNDEMDIHHWISLGWDTEKKDLICRFSLFGINTYRVQLCNDFSSKIWLPIKSEHIFNVSTGIINKLM